MAAIPTTLLPDPLRLPRGSVRGVIAIIVTATSAYLLIRATPVPAVLVNSVVVVIAFYFGTRFAPPAAATVQGQPVSRRPRIVQSLLFLGFVGLAAWFLRQNLSLCGIPPELLSVLEVLAGYVAGIAVAWLLHRKIEDSSLRRRLATIARDLLAVGALGLTGYLCFTIATGQVGLFAGRGEEALALVVTFYFGSRVLER